MTTPAATLALAPTAPSPAARFVLAGGLTVALLDGLDATFFFGSLGVSAPRVWKSVASGVLGQEAFEGGAPTVALGLFLHLIIATGIVVTYALVARHWALLRERPWLVGPLYGIVVYQVMEKVIVPLSAAPFGGRQPSLPVLINGVLGHAFLIGLPAALWGSRAVRH